MKVEEIKKVMASKGYAFFEGPWNVNLIGIRKDNKLSNQFDDTFLLIYQDDDYHWVMHEFTKFTTDPGEYYSQKKLLNPEGVAIMVPGQYKSIWKFGLHRGKYDALVQRGKVTVYRDSNKDIVIDLDSETDTGLFGINLHHAAEASTVGKYSAGCQVFQYPRHLKSVLDILHKSAEKYGDSFTYTLLEEKDF